MSLRYDTFQRTRILQNHREIFNHRVAEGNQGDVLYSVRKTTTNKYKDQRREREEKFDDRKREVDTATEKIIERRHQEKVERERTRNLEKEREYVAGLGHRDVSQTIQERKQQRDEDRFNGDRKKKELTAQWQRTQREIDAARDRANNKRDRRINYEMERNKPKRIRIPVVDTKPVVLVSVPSTTSYKPSTYSSSSSYSSSYSSTSSVPSTRSTSSYSHDVSTDKEPTDATRPRSYVDSASTSTRVESSHSPRKEIAKEALSEPGYSEPHHAVQAHVHDDPEPASTPAQEHTYNEPTNNEPAHEDVHEHVHSEPEPVYKAPEPTPAPAYHKEPEPEHPAPAPAPAPAPVPEPAPEPASVLLPEPATAPEPAQPEPAQPEPSEPEGGDEQVDGEVPEAVEQQGETQPEAGGKKKRKKKKGKGGQQ